MTRTTGRLLVLAMATAGVAACGGNDQTTIPAPRDAAAVRVIAAPVAAIDTTERIEAGGTIEAQTAAAMSSRIIATIATISVKSGDRVRAGQTVITLDGAELGERTRQAQAGAQAAEQSLAQARAARAAADAEQQLAAAWERRITGLHARQSATDQERDDAQARLSVAASHLASAQAGIEAADAQLAAAVAARAVAAATESYAVLRAPFDGLVTERLADPGTLAVPGVALLRIESGGARQAVVRVDEARAALIQPGDHVRVRVGGDATGDDVEGVVTEVGRALGVDQRAFAVKVALPETMSTRSGRFARVVFSGASRRALTVPATAIRRRGQVSSVFVVEDGTARLRLVQSGERTGDDVEVLAGLESGEVVVVQPPAGFADGTAVTVQTAASVDGARR